MPKKCNHKFYYHDSWHFVMTAVVSHTNNCIICCYEYAATWTLLKFDEKEGRLRRWTVV